MQLLEKNLDYILHVPRETRCIKSVLKPPAQTVIPCASNTQDTLQFSAYITQLNIIKQIDVKVYYIINIMLYGACRISEVLLIKYHNISLLGQILIKSSKKSPQRIITIPNCIDYLVSCKNNCVDPFNDYNRFYIYRLMLKYGMVFESVRSSKKSVCHSARHINFADMRQSGYSQDEISSKNIHKNQKNLVYYGNKKS